MIWRAQLLIWTIQKEKDLNKSYYHPEIILYCHHEYNKSYLQQNEHEKMCPTMAYTNYMKQIYTYTLQ